MLLSEIKYLVNVGYAIDLQTVPENTLKSLKFRTIAKSNGAYGINGKLLQDVNTNKLYAITSRCSLLDRF